MSKQKVERFYDRVSKVYDASYTDLYWRLYQKVTWENLRKYLPRDLSSKILDIGGGTGLWTVKIAKAGYNVILADISAGMLDVAQKKCEQEKISQKVQFVKCDICDMSQFQNETFDLVLSEGDPLSCCSNARKAVKEIHRILKAKGKAICSVDNKFGAIHYFLDRGKLDEIEKFLDTGLSHWLTEEQQEQYDVRFFEPDEIRRIFEQAGFRVVSLIGKTVIPWKRYYKILENKDSFEQIARIEMALNRENTMLGSASHIEIVAEKEDLKQARDDLKQANENAI